MNKELNISKISSVILVVGVVVVAAFMVASVFLLKRKTIEKKPLNEQEISAGAQLDSIKMQFEEYQTFDLDLEYRWSEPVANGSNDLWRYDLFTPPRIYINPQTGEFEPTPYQFESAPTVPVFAITQLNRPLFAFQLSGYIEKSLVDASQSLLLIEDVENNHNTLRLPFKVGQSIGNDCKMVSFEIERVMTPNGGIQRIGKLTVEAFDGTSYLLLSNSPTYLSGYTIDVIFGESNGQLTEENREIYSGDYKVVWLSEETLYPHFNFKLLKLDGSLTQPLSLQTYLP